MYKTLVLNTDEWVQPLRMPGCFAWNYDEFTDIAYSKKKSEERLSEMFNAVARQGFRLIDERIRRHNVFNDNEYYDHGYHGVYLFEEDKSSAEEYYFYFGPVIKIPRHGCKVGCGKMGCKGVGCKGIGCKGVGCKGSRLPWQGCGCHSNDSDEQFINFLDDNNNNPTVQKLNKYFMLRTVPHSLDDSYAWEVYTEDVPEEATSEKVKELEEEINAAFDADIKAIEAKGYHFRRMIDLPSDGDTYTSAMLFTRTSKSKVRLSITRDEEALRQTINISDFDLWYYPTVYGFFGWLAYKVLGSIPVIGKLFRGKSGKGERETAILKKEELEAQYDRDFNSQQSKAASIREILDRNARRSVHNTTVEIYQREHGAFLTFVLRLFVGITYDRILRDQIPFIAEK